MPTKDRGPLFEAQREGDLFKKQIDELVGVSDKPIKDLNFPNRSVKLKELSKKCENVSSGITRLHKKVQKLTKVDEPGKVSDFEGKKEAELKRLVGLKERVDKLSNQLVPDEVEEDYLRKMKKREGAYESESVMDEDEDEEDEDEEEEEEDNDYDDEASDNPNDQGRYLGHLCTNQNNRSLTKKRRKDAEEDGDYDDEDDEEEEEDDDDEEEYETEEEGTASDGDAMSVEVTKVVKYEAISDYQAREKGDLSFDEGEILTLIQIRDDGWWEAENEEGERGLVPSTYLKEYSKYRDIQTEDTTQEETEFQESGNKSSRLWKTIKNAVKETSATDVLHAMGAVPSGFRPSTLSKLHSESDLYTMVNYLAPKLSTSNLAYRDLFFDPATNKIRSRPVRVQKVIQLVNCRQIPLAAAGVDVLSRYVRICLFDGSHVLSNIQVVRAMADKDQRTWTFTAKTFEFPYPLTPSASNTSVADNSIDFAELFIRSNMTNKNVGILFELSLIYERTKTKEKSELSCGWTLLPLFQEGGIPLANKTYDQILHGGTPYEKGVEVDPSISRRAVSTNPIKSLISRNKQPRMSIKVSAPSREQKEQLDTLPDVLVGSMCYLPALSFYRITLADTLLRDRPDTQSTEVIPSPFLAWFPKVAEAHDLMDALRNGWTEKLKTAKRSDKRDVEYLKELFRQTFMEYVYPLLHCSSIPPAVVGDAENERVRKEEISKIMAKKTQAQSIVAALLSQDIVFEPFEVKELSFDPIGPYCNNG